MSNTMEQMEAYYRDWGPDLLGYFRSRHGSAQVAEDLLQDTFAQALRHWDRLVGATSPRAYLFGIARHLSSRAYRQVRIVEPLSENLALEPVTDGDPRLELMRHALGSLPQMHREILELRLRHELSYEELAQVLGVPLGTVRSRLHAATLSLRKKMVQLNNTEIRDGGAS